MNCKSVLPLLSAYIDRELVDNELFEVRAHLSDCSACREEMENLKSLKRLLGSLDCPEPPPGFEDRLITCVRCERKGGLDAQRTYRSFVVFAGVAVCSMFITLLVINGVSKPMSASGADGAAIAREIDRDRFLSSGGSPFMGAPVVNAAGYGGR